MKKIIIQKNDSGRTVLKFLEKMLTNVPKSRLEKAFRNKDLKINGKRINDKKIILKTNDTLEIFGIDFETKFIKYQKVQKKFNVVYEDKFILVVNKEANVVVSDEPGSLTDQIMNYLKFKQTNSFVISSIGRLDKKTSGLIVFPKDYKTLRELKEKNHLFTKIYIFKSDLPFEKTVDFKISHDETRQKQSVSDKGKATKTRFFFEKNQKFAQIYTGRKHQIRVSLSKLGYPIFGDCKYGGKKADRLFLHCYELKFAGLSKRLDSLNNLQIIQKPNWN